MRAKNPFYKELYKSLQINRKGLFLIIIDFSLFLCLKMINLLMIHLFNAVKKISIFFYHPDLLYFTNVNYFSDAIPYVCKTIKSSRKTTVFLITLINTAENAQHNFLKHNPLPTVYTLNSI